MQNMEYNYEEILEMYVTYTSKGLGANTCTSEKSEDLEFLCNDLDCVCCIFSEGNTRSCINNRNFYETKEEYLSETKRVLSQWAERVSND